MGHDASIKLEIRLRAVSLFLGNCGKNANQTWERDCDRDSAVSAASGSRYRRSHVTLTVTLARLPILRSSPQIFDEKRDCSPSSLRLKSDVTKLVYFD